MQQHKWVICTKKQQKKKKIQLFPLAKERRTKLSVKPQQALYYKHKKIKDIYNISSLLVVTYKNQIRKAIAINNVRESIFENVLLLCNSTKSFAQSSISQSNISIEYLRDLSNGSLLELSFNLLICKFTFEKVKQ